MKNNNLMIPKLYTTLASELEGREPYLSWRNYSEGDRQRQGLSLTNARYFIAVLDNHILERTGSVIATIDTAADCCTLRFYRPLQPKEYNRLASSGYAPVLRSKIYLTVGVGRSADIPYAFSSVKLSQYAGLLDVFDALVVLGKELELFIKQCN